MDNTGPATILDLSTVDRAALALAARGLRDAVKLPAAKARVEILDALGRAWSGMSLEGIESTLAGRGKDLLRTAVEALPQQAQWAIVAWLKVNGAERFQITNVLDDALTEARQRWPEVKAAALQETAAAAGGAA
jgi:hypothetical protein